MEDSIVIYAVIPKEIYTTKLLTSGEKLIAERITSLCKKEGYCWITNKALGDMYGIREDKISKYIRNLKNYGFIKCIYRKNDQYKSNRVIYLTNYIWDKYTGDSRLYEQESIGYLKGHSNKYNINYSNKYNIPTKKNLIEPEWLGKNIEDTKASKEEQEEMENLLKDYK
ncbi:MAG: helix-turn-helix domain-containing protein [Bacilli bacterium]|nr:helix-turn-helix domain-containing protein [Bacilli bacterium]